MIDWSSLGFNHLWPLWLGLVAACLLAGVWFSNRMTRFPDISLIKQTSPGRGTAEGLVPLLGVILLLLLMLVLMEPTVVRTETVEKRARDFLVLVDTSRSMRHDTAVRRDSIDLHFTRRVGSFDTVVEDPSSMPFLARYELARESLLSFLARRKGQDRVGMIYFNDDAYTMSSPTTNLEFVTNQLASMDDYVNWGTDIATALDSALSLLDRYPEQNKRTLIMLTDAEARYTREVEQQLARLAGQDISFYMLWITADEQDMSNEDVESLLDQISTIGSIVTIKDLDSNTLENAMLEISRLEGYGYEEVQRQRLDLSWSILRFTLWLLLAWLVLLATFFHPAATGTISERKFS